MHGPPDFCLLSLGHGQVVDGADFVEWGRGVHLTERSQEPLGSGPGEQI